MISLENGKVKIKGDPISVNEDLGIMILHAFAFADSYPDDKLVKALFQDMILQSLILAGCDVSPEFMDKIEQDDEFICILRDMIEPVNDSIKLIRNYIRDKEIRGWKNE